MRMRAFISAMMGRARPLEQRTAAILLLALVLLMVIDPIWECHDHLDTLRHLGPHGMLLILLMVAIAGVLLLKSPSWLMFFIRRDALGAIMPLCVPRIGSAVSLAPLANEAGPPLRI